MSVSTTFCPGSLGLRLTVVILTALLPAEAVTFAQTTEESTPAIQSATTMLGLAVRSSAVESRFLRTRNEEEPVSTRMLNSDVTGTQNTVTETRLRFLPSASRIHLELINSGDVSSRTTGINRQALVESTGQHHFEIIKPMWFDGDRFLTLKSYGTIQAATTPNRVLSAVGARMPLLGPMGDQVAWNEVMRRRPQIDREAAEQVSRDVLPKVDRIIDQDFERLGREWKSLKDRMDSGFGIRLTWSAASSREAIQLTASAASQLPARNGTRDPVTGLRVRGDEDVVVCVSEPAVNQLLRQWIPGGRRIADTQLMQLQSLLRDQSAGQESGSALQSLLSNCLAMEPVEPALFELQFAGQDPFRVRFDGGDVSVIARFQVRPRLGPQSGWLDAATRFHGQGLSGDAWTIRVRGVNVVEEVSKQNETKGGSIAGSDPQLSIPNEPAVPPEAEGGDSGDVRVATQESAWPDLVRGALQSLAEKLPSVTLPKEIDGAAVADGIPRLRLIRIESDDGILRISWRLLDPPSVAFDR